MNEVSILIVGAGPSGLMLACQLARFGVPFRIIDGKSGPTLQSRAMVVQSRSIEIYDQLGLGDEVYKLGHMLNGMEVYIGGEKRTYLDLKELGKGLSPFAGVLILEQSKNESMLVAKLLESGHEVEWKVSFKSLQMHNTYADVTLDNGEVVRADWVVACDGARSAVRHSLKLPFVGGTYEQTFYVADVDEEGELLTRDFGKMFMAQTGFALAFPMPGGQADRRLRLIGSVPSEASEIPGWMENPDFQVVADAFRTITSLPLKLAKPAWFATYSVHHRKLDRFRHGRALFVGDAAHVHSPAGGQGMNTGLLDAHNLAWKLNYVASGLADERLLDSYDFERERFARQLLSTTDTAFGLLAGPNPVNQFLRLNVLPLLVGPLLSFPFMKEQFFRLLSQTAISYRDSPLSRTKGRRGKLQAGDRFPPIQVVVNDESVPCSLDLFKSSGFYALDFTDDGTDGKQVFQNVENKIGVTIHYHKCWVSDSTKKAGIDRLCYTIRPDMYIGLTTAKVDGELIVDFMKRNIGISM